MQNILDELKTHLVINIDDYTPFPQSYIGEGEIKAIVIGADPSTKDKTRFKSSVETLQFDYMPRAILDQLDSEKMSCLEESE